MAEKIDINETIMPESKELIKEVYKTHSSLTASELSYYTHLENTPWYLTWKHYKGRGIIFLYKVQYEYKYSYKCYCIRLNYI